MKFYATLAAVALILCAGCTDTPGEDERAQDLQEEMPVENHVTPEPGTGASESTSPPRASAPPPELAPVYSAKITKVDVSASDDFRYDVEIIFTSAQGRTFTAIVQSDGGNMIHTETITDVPDAYYAHVFSFHHSGDVSDLNVQVISPDEKTILDKWDL